MKKKNLIDFAIQNTLDIARKVECDKRRIFHEGYTNYNANLNRDLAIIFIGHVKAAKGYEYSFKNFPFYRLLYTVSGQASLKYSQKTLIMKNGSICGFAPKDTGTVSVKSDAVWEHYYLHFTGKEAAKVFYQTMLNTKKMIQTSNPSKFCQYFENMLEEERAKLDSSHIINVYLLMAMLLKLTDEAYNDTRDHSWRSRETYLLCRNYINEHFSEITCFQNIGDKCNISKTHLCYLFKQYTDISPMSYVMNLKMNNAAILLMQTDMSIKQISRSLHFEDQYYFSKLFKKHYGMPPKFYRRKN